MQRDCSTTWREQAACRGMGTDKFFIGRGFKQSDLDQVREICNDCTVGKECEQYGNATRSLGIWNGKSAAQREKEAGRRFKVHLEKQDVGLSRMTSVCFGCGVTVVEGVGHLCVYERHGGNCGECGRYTWKLDLDDLCVRCRARLLEVVA